MKEPTIYLNSKDVPLTEALEKLTDECLDEGNYCTQTVIDLRDVLKKSLKEIKDLNSKKKKIGLVSDELNHILNTQNFKNSFEGLVISLKKVFSKSSIKTDSWAFEIILFRFIIRASKSNKFSMSLSL